MSYGETQLTMPVAPAGYGGYGGGGIFGNNNDILGVLFLVALLNGNGNGGNLFGGGNNGGEVQRGFDHSATINKLDGITTGLADLGFALNNSITAGFSNAELGASNRMAQLMQMLFGMQMDQQKCCCESKADIQALRYDIATQGCDTRRAIEDGTRRVTDMLFSQQMEAKNERIAAQDQRIFQLELAASQANQNISLNVALEAGLAELYRRLAPPTPGPAWIVPNPNSYNGANCCGFF